jgi:AraC-like DNA-binding protein
MVSTFQIKPSLILQPFIDCYALRIINSKDGILQPQYAQPQYYLSFILSSDKFCNLIDASGKFQCKLSSTLCTIYTEYQGCVLFQGIFILFSAVFKANGLLAIFNIPQKILINDMLPIEDIIGNDYRLLSEQLQSFKDINEMGACLNKYFERKLFYRKHKTYTTAIASVSNIILRSKGLASIDNLVSNVNMSLRNFERRFITEVGIPAKLYMRITRFHNAVLNKMQHPDKTWTDITYENGYYDQSHFIKDCREFSSRSPEEFFKYTPPAKEKFTEVID